MTDQNSNPFVLPGMGQGSGEAAGNPLLASMEMMRQAWTTLTGPGGLAQALPMAPPMNLEDLERRIAELRTVESWLRMNLSMLSSTIQGLEVQRSTIATLRSFVDNLGAQGQDFASWGDASPLEVVLGLKPAPRQSGAQSREAAGQSEPPRESRAAAPVGRQDTDAGGQAQQPASSADDLAQPASGAAQAGSGASGTGQDAASGVPSAGSAQAISQAAQSASEAWWGMLQQQFNQLASATAATMPGGAASGKPAHEGAAGDPAAAAQEAAGAGKTSPGTGAVPKSGASRKGAGSARKAAPRKTAVKKNKIQSGPGQS